MIELHDVWTAYARKVHPVQFPSAQNIQKRYMFAIDQKHLFQIFMVCFNLYHCSPLHCNSIFLVSGWVWGNKILPMKFSTGLNIGKYISSKRIQGSTHSLHYKMWTVLTFLSSQLLLCTQIQVMYRCIANIMNLEKPKRLTFWNRVRIWLPNAQNNGH